MRTYTLKALVMLALTVIGFGTVPRASFAGADGDCSSQRARLEARHIACKDRCERRFERSLTRTDGRALDQTACTDRCRGMYEKMVSRLAAGSACETEEIADVDFGTSASPAMVKGIVHLPDESVEVDLPVVDGDAIFQGDIIVGRADDVETEQHKRSAARSRDASRWPLGIIPYTIESTLPNQARVTDAIRHWQANTPIRFVNRTTETAYVTFRLGSGCSSSVGRTGAQQFVNLAAGCTTGATIHEIGHAVGLWHEQSRTDRDSNVIVNWSNIKEAMKGNFRTYAELGNDGLNIDFFDFDSIMLYPSFISDPAFVINAAVPVMTRRNGTTFNAQRTGLSAQDIAAVRFLYRKPTGSLIGLGDKCVEVRGGYTTNRTPLQINSCATTGTSMLAQRWFPLSGTMRSRLAPTKVIDMPYATNGAGVWLFDAWGGANQRFDLSEVQIRTTGGNCVGAVPGVWQSLVASCTTTTGEMASNSFTTRTWTYTPSREIRTAGGLCLDVRYWETRNGTPVVAHPCNGGANQKWDLAANGQIRGYGNKCLDVTGWLDRAGTGLQIWDCIGGTNQSFVLRGQIREPGGRCLDLPGSSTANGTPVNVWGCHTGANQKFDFFP